MTGPRPLHNLALIGFMGVGKSSVGRQVARVLGFEFMDTDELIEQRAGCSIPEIFARQGEPAFRAMERDLVAEMGSWHGKVIATGGGLGANPDHLASLKSHALVVCLWATPETIWKRVRHQSHRPLLQGPDPETRIRTLLETRTPVYRQADVLVNTEHRDSREVADHVLNQYRLARQQPPPASNPA
jgi:shikimate kinase